MTVPWMFGDVSWLNSSISHFCYDGNTFISNCEFRRARNGILYSPEKLRASLSLPVLVFCYSESFYLPKFHVPDLFLAQCSTAIQEQLHEKTCLASFFSRIVLRLEDSSLV